MPTKYFQAAVLGCLAVIAGLLFAIFQDRRPDTVAAPETVELSPLPEPVAEPVAEPEMAVVEKPSPVVAKPQPTSRPRPNRPAVSQPEPARMDSPARTALPVEPPAPVPGPEPSLTAATTFVDAKPAAPPEPRVVTLQQGAEIVIRVTNTLSTNRNVAGDSFQGALEEPLVADGWVIAEKGARVEGRVLEAEKAGRVKGVSRLVIDLTSLTASDGQVLDISTEPFLQEGDKSTRADAAKVGIGAGIGAVIGAIAGGGKGAAIGAGAGAGAGTGTVLATRGEPTVIPSETRLSFRLRDSMRVEEKL